MNWPYALPRKKQNLETNHARGFRAEAAAAQFLENLGYTILKSRYKTKLGEIDIITKRNKLICFVEVKMRQTEAEALEAVNARTRRRIENAALIFLNENPEFTDYEMRFDVIAIIKPFSILHLDNAWEAGA